MTITVPKPASKRSEGVSLVITVTEDPSREQVGELMTREIEAEGGATAALRAARERMKRGHFRTQADVERD